MAEGDENTTMRGYADLSAPQKSAIVMRAVGQDKAKAIFDNLRETERKQIVQAMAELGNIEAGVVDQVLEEFADRLDDNRSVVGTPQITKQFLEQGNILPTQKIDEYLEDLEGPGGETIWQKLNNIPDQSLFGFLIQQHSQFIAYVLSSLDSTKAGRILTLMPYERAANIAYRVAAAEPIDDTTRETIEATLTQEVLSNKAQFTAQGDGTADLAQVLNRANRARTESIMSFLEDQDESIARRVRKNMFTFDDLMQLDAVSLRKVLAKVDQEDLKKAIVNEGEETRERIFGNMSERAGKGLRRDLAEIGRVRRADIEAARMRMIETARGMEQQGEIILTADDDDEADV